LQEDCLAFQHHALPDRVAASHHSFQVPT
jgi:hypothetical protein